MNADNILKKRFLSRYRTYISRDTMFQNINNFGMNPHHPIWKCMILLAK